MTTMEAANWPGAACPSCGASLASGSGTCPSCGRAVGQLIAPDRAASHAPDTAPTLVSASLDAPTVPGRGWPISDELPPARVAPAGMAALAGTPVAPRAARAGARRGVFASIAAVCLLALLAGGVYWAYAALVPTPSQTALARYFPESTLAYVALDLQAAGQSGHHASLQTLIAGSPSSALLKSAGLDWATDVQPWAGPMMALGVYATLPSGTAAAAPNIGALSAAGVTVVLQSHDDTAAQRAVRKALSHQEGAGATYTTASYGGYTLYLPAAKGGSPSALALGRGMVLIASSQAAVQTAIDRAGGTGNSLYGESSFQQAISGLPEHRFGTLYYNVKALTDPTGLGANVITLPFVDTYPTGAGTLQWTSAGMRWQLTMAPTHTGVPGASLAGDTTSLAALVPADAASYVGVANLGALSQQLSTLLASGENTRGTPDLLAGVLGVPASAPGAQVPAAVFSEMSAQSAAQTQQAQAQATPAIGTGVLLREPSAQAAATLLNAIGEQQHWTRKDTTIAGVPAASYYAAGQADAQAVAAYYNGVVIVSETSAGLERVVAVAQGKAASLGQAATFRQLLAAAPANAAATLYGSTGVLGAMLGGVPFVPTATPSGTPATDALGTLAWTSSSLQVTYDMALP